MRKLIYISLIAVIVAGCAKKAVGNAPTENTAIQVDSLFTRGGCTVYRFFDAGHYVYYTVCHRTNRGYDTQTFYQYSCGKGCTRPRNVSVTEEL